jgi:hypothetical protein
MSQTRLNRRIGLGRPAPNAAKLLDDAEVGALFGLGMAEPAIPEAPIAVDSQPPGSTASKRSKTTVGKKASPKNKAMRTKPGSKLTPRSAPRKKQHGGRRVLPK